MTEWVHKKLGDLGCSFSGLSGKTIDDFGEGKPFIPYMNIFTNGKIDPSKLEFVRIADNEHQNKVEKGDWFFTTSSETPEEVGMTSVLVDDIGEAYLNSFCFGFRLYNKEEIDPEFASYLFRSEELRKKISLFAQGSTRYNLPKQQMFEKLFISYPESLAAQRRIAAILASADKVIAATQKTIAKYKQIRQGMMEDLLNEQCTMNNVQWRKVKLGEFIELQGGFAFQSRDFSNSGVPLIRIGDITPNGLNISNSAKLPIDYLVEYENFVLNNNDTVIAMSGATTGKCTLVTQKDLPALLNQRVGRFRIKNNSIDKLFLYYIVSNNVYQQKLLIDAVGGAQPNVSPKQIESVFCNVPILSKGAPNLPAQRRIAAILSGIDAKIAAEEKVLEKYEKVKKGLMERLLNEE